VNRSSGNWSIAAESQPSARSQIRASGSFKRAASHAAAGRPSSAAAPGSSPEKGDRLAGGTHRPCMPARVPSARPSRDVQVAAAGPGRTDEPLDKDDEVRHCYSCCWKLLLCSSDFAALSCVATVVSWHKPAFVVPASHQVIHQQFSCLMPPSKSLSACAVWCICFQSG
jgi:hypothetical protein